MIAGSTGAGAATRRLMEAVLELPMGLIVFPGIDPDLDNQGWVQNVINGAYREWVGKQYGAKA